MENEKKNEGAMPGGKKNHRNRRPHHKKHNNGGERPEAERAEKKSAPETATPAAPQNNSQPKGQGQNAQSSGGQGRRNRNRHNRHHDKRQEEGVPQRTDAELFESRVNPTSPSLSSRPLADDEFDFRSPLESTILPEDIAVANEILNLEEQAEREEKEREESALPEQDVERVEIVGVRFKPVGKIYYFDPAGLKISRGKYAIVETARGPEYGEVCLANTTVAASEITPPLRPVIRVATEEDAAHHNENRQKEDEAFSICLEKIVAHGLDMKLVETQYTFDNSKLLFYFTSAGRVDFRELVKDLASIFRTRIELRQIGIRDEAKLMGGLGTCGRPLCCSRFLSDFVQVSIKMAKEQNLSLNSAKISGVCGRLMCCLNYEYETYEEEIRKTPPLESVVDTPDGVGVICEISPITATVKVRLKDKPDTQPKTYMRTDVKVISLGRPQKQDEED